MLPDGIALVDEHGVISYSNQHLVNLSGYALDKLMGMTIEDLVKPEHRETHLAHRTKFFEEPSSRQMAANLELELLCYDGSELPVDIGLAPINIEGRQFVLSMVRDRSLQKKSERARIESEERFRLAFEDNMAPMIVTDLHDRAIAVNDAFCEMIGYTSEEVIGHDSRLFTFPDDVGISEASRHRVRHDERDQVRYLKRYLHKNGRIIDVEVSRSPARDINGKTIYYIISERDITDRTQRDKMLELITQVNRLATYALNEVEFRQQLCDLLVVEGGYPLVWIGAASPENEGIDIICSSGASDFLYGEMSSWWGTKESGTGLAGTALRTGTSQVRNNFASDAAHGMWRKREAEFGFGSSVAIADQIGFQKVVFVIYDRHVLAFDESVVKGLEEIVREARFAVIHLRAVQRTAAALEETLHANQVLTETEHALIESEQRFRVAFEDNMAPMVFSDLGDNVIAVNDAFCDMVGFTREELMGHDSKQFTHPEDIGITEGTHVRLTNHEVDQLRYVKRYLRKDGRTVVSEVSRSAARDANEKTLYFVSSERDITEEQNLTTQLSHQALHDPLTGLANRALFEDRLTQAHSRVIRQGGYGAVLLLDLDDFKGVNDTYGHLVGDQLLMGIARRLESVTRSTDTLCRLGGDEFLYLAEGLSSFDEADEVAKRLLASLNQPFVLDNVTFEQHASIGVVVWDTKSADPKDIVRNADVALYESKRQRRNNYTVFTPSMQQQAINRFALVQELRHALHEGELAMHYQPIVDLTTTEVVGFEALMRWQHPERGWVPPSVFIPLAEQSELILELGSFAIREAVRAAIAWQPANPESTRPYVTVNLSAHQFRDPGLVALIEETLRNGNLDPDCLILEITEGVALLDITETMNVMSHFNRLGIRVALDDFGTGFSSLSYLVRLHPKIIKIDQYFINPANESAQNDSLLETIVSLGNKLQMTMLAEGIETQEQLEQLRELKCAFGQGYLFSPAVPENEAALQVGRVFGI